MHGYHNPDLFVEGGVRASCSDEERCVLLHVGSLPTTQFFGQVSDGL